MSPADYPPPEDSSPQQAREGWWFLIPGYQDTYFWSFRQPGEWFWDYQKPGPVKWRKYFQTTWDEGQQRYIESFPPGTFPQMTCKHWYLHLIQPPGLRVRECPRGNQCPWAHEYFPHSLKPEIDQGPPERQRTSTPKVATYIPPTAKAISGFGAASSTQTFTPAKHSAPAPAQAYTAVPPPASYENPPGSPRHPHPGMPRT